MNIATIQTSHEFADNVYFVPITPDFIEKVMAAEKVDAVLLSFGWRYPCRRVVLVM
jgi:carbamoyl-phosphate synthase large subunit